MKRSRIPKLGLLLCLVLIGCVDLSPIETADTEHYTLNTPHQSLTLPKEGKTILILMPNVTAAYDTPRMAYQMVPYQISYFAEHRWIASPDRLLQPLLVQTLENTGKFKAVIPAPFSGKLDYYLETMIIDWYQDFTVPKTAYVHVTLSFLLMDIKNQEILGSTRFKVSEPCQADPQSGVAATDRAIQKILQRFTTFVIDRIGERTLHLPLARNESAQSSPGGSTTETPHPQCLTADFFLDTFAVPPLSG